MNQYTTGRISINLTRNSVHNENPISFVSFVLYANECNPLWYLLKWHGRNKWKRNITNADIYFY